MTDGHGGAHTAGRDTQPTARRERCDQIHEADRILRAHSPLGVLCTPVDGPMLTTPRVGMLYEEAKHRLGRRPPGYDLTRVPTPSYDLRMPGMICSTQHDSERNERDGSEKDGKDG